MLRQDEANQLIEMPKEFEHPRTITLIAGMVDSHPLVALDNTEKFVLDLRRGTIRLSKATYQTRARNVIVLVRLDIDGPPHTNPDGERVECPHLHVYRENFEDKWAQPLSQSEFSDPTDLPGTLQEFCAYCSIDGVPTIQAGLE